MTTNIVVPALGESVSEAIVAKWFKNPGDAVALDEPLLELETDKVTLEVNATAAGMLEEIVAKAGATVAVGAVLGKIKEGAAGAKSAPVAAPVAAVAAPAAAPVVQQAAAGGMVATAANSGPAVRKMLAETGVNPAQVSGTGKDGRLTKGDVISFVEKGGAAAAAAPVAAGPREERVRMSKLRQVIAKRLKESQNTAAILTTFNEVDMSAAMALRNSTKEAFEEKYGVRLGFMSFFVKAAVAALKQIPEVNAQIDGTDIVYKNYYDIGVAVGTESGLVVPVVRDADRLGFAGVESEINRLAKKARDGALSMDELSGGTFTISNGGVYGSLLATPIINPPQSGILGLHNIVKRPVVVNDQIVIRPMMYIALSYDHRIIDGRESVTFLKTVKQYVEDPQRLLLEV
ncbi:MAG: 2-oxoglutarate dehydrogenase complex dihydrolipoyllysine-residue succinyltransferase [Alphaproteobacteria bacterium]|nr:2-oxoglutarate dehydrogenase complex dihydrolipoyllysine-residue succinyltransferase [Alphaproteobacteria bacterium]